MKEVFFTEEILHKIIDALHKAYKDGEIFINDGDGDRIYKVTEKTNKNSVLAYLVLEEDDSIRFYFHPNEHTDVPLLEIPVEFVDYEKLEVGLKDVIARFMVDNDLSSEIMINLMDTCRSLLSKPGK
jgi:hypothetical protein